MNEVEFLLKFLSVSKQILSARLAFFLSIMLTFSLFAWTMYSPDYWRLSAATIFAILVFLPIIRLESSQRNTEAKAGSE